MAHILVVDDAEFIREVLPDQLAVLGHTADVADGGLAAMERLRRREYDLIISDIHMPGMTGLEFLKRIHPEIHRRTPCMIITAWAELQYAVDAMQAGACNFLVKPWELQDLTRAVGRALELREDYVLRLDYQRELEQKLDAARQEVRRTYEGTVSGIAAMLEGKDTSTVEHCQRVAEYCTLVAVEMGVTPDRIPNIRLGAMLHDIGKYKVPDAVLLKRGKLTPEEWVEMRKHPAYGAEFVSRIPFLAGAREIIENHHERWDGGGYPRGLSGDQIPLAARIFFVCDAYDAITSKRCYKEALPHDFAREEIARCAGTQFDPAVVHAFLRVVDRFPEVVVGSSVHVDYAGHVDRVAAPPREPAEVRAGRGLGMLNGIGAGLLGGGADGAVPAA